MFLKNYEASGKTISELSTAIPVRVVNKWKYHTNPNPRNVNKESPRIHFKISNKNINK